MRMLKKFFVPVIVLWTVLFMACSETNTAGGTVVDPNTIASESSSSAGSDIGVDDDSIFVPSIDPSDIPVSCTGENGENSCLDSLFDDDAKLYHESEHCKVKINEGEPMYMYFGSDEGPDSTLVGFYYFQVGLVYFNGNRYARVEESINDIGHDFGEGNIYVRTSLGSGSEICNDLLNSMNSLAQTRMDSLEVWGVSGGMSRWSDTCDEGTLNMTWRETILPSADVEKAVADVRTYLNEKAEQYKKDCERWESLK